MQQAFSRRKVELYKTQVTMPCICLPWAELGHTKGDFIQSIEPGWGPDHNSWSSIFSLLPLCGELRKDRIYDACYRLERNRNRR